MKGFLRTNHYHELLSDSDIERRKTDQSNMIR